MRPMIVIWAIATVYALAAIIHAYEKYDTHRERRIRREQVTREARNPLNPLPQPVPSKQVRYSEPDDSWVITHAEALTLLSPSLVAEFTEPKKGTPSSVPTTLVTERSEVTSTGSPQRLPNRP